MANEISLTVSMTATNLTAVPVAHSTGAKSFSMASGKDDVFKESKTVGTSYETLPLGDVAYTNGVCLILTNRSTAGGTNYLFVSFNDGSNTHCRIPPQGTMVIWPDVSLGSNDIWVKFSNATVPIMEITCCESNV